MDVRGCAGATLAASFSSNDLNLRPDDLDVTTSTNSRLGARLGLAALAACTHAVDCTGPGTKTAGSGTAGTTTTAAATPAALPANCTALETRAPNATGQTPAFPGQTRICGVASNVGFDVVELTKALDHPWSVEPMPDGRLLVTERAGRMRIVSASGQLGEPIAGVPAVAAAGQGGLLDVALGPTFAQDRTIFWTFSEPRDGGNGTAIARGVLAADGTRVDDVRVIFHVQPTYNGRQHYGSRIAFGPDGMLYASFGERSV